jgi:hypothetical protein
MPCDKCNQTRIFWEGWICPYCKGLAILDSFTANEIAKKQVIKVKNLWNEHLKILDKKSVLANMVWQREKQCREFFGSYSTLKIDYILSQTLLIKRLMKNEYSSDNGKKIEDENSAKELLELHSKTLRIEESQMGIEMCLSKMLYLKKFELDEIVDNQLFKNFITCRSEKYEKLTNSYKQYNIMSEVEAKKLVEKGKAELDLLKEEIRPHPFTKEEFVTKLYDLICTIYFGLLRNRLYLEAFDLRNYNELLTDPVEIIKFTKTFAFGEGGISVCNTAEFLIRAKKFFKKDVIFLRKILLFEKENSDIFPLFVRIKDKEYDYVLISHKFSEIAYIFLHAVITKKIFDAETEKRSKEFEQKIKTTFENQDFKYFPNILDKKNATMEIDGVGVKTNHCIIVEAKAKRLPTLIEENTRRRQVIRDVKGVVDGIKYSTKNRQEIKKKVPSLLEKIEYVKQHKILFGIDDVNKIKFTGVIVTLNYSWISEYKKIQIITYEQLDGLLQTIDTSKLDV